MPSKNSDMVSSLQKVQYHRTSHDSDADKSNLHTYPSFVYILLAKLLHLDDSCSTFDNRSLLHIYSSYFTCIRGGDGMLHLHSTKNNQHLALFDRVTVTGLYLNDCAGHGCGKYFLCVRNIAIACGCLDSRRLMPL